MARILVADDDPDFLAWAAAALRARHEVRTAPDGREAAALLRAARFDLVVSDVRMPVVGGFRLAEQAAEAGGPPIIFTSSRDHRGEAALRGGAAFLAKPLTARRLRDAAAEVLAGARAAHTVLLVEDDPHLRDLFTDALAGFEVVTAADAEAALDVLARRDDVSLVLADYALPRLDGEALVRRIRGDARTAGLPVLVHTAMDEPSRESLTASLGVENVFEKTEFLRLLLAGGELRKSA